MIQHIVLFKWKEEISAEEKNAAIVALASLQTIEDVGEFSAGGQLGKLAKGYDYAVTLRLSDLAALKTYWSHPKHVAALAVVQPLTSDVLVADYEV
jgi:hypothetical protein